MVLVYALSYAIQHKAGNDAAANPFAAAAWAGFQSPYFTAPVSYISRIVVSGGVATVTFSNPPASPLKAGGAIGIWGCATDALCGPHQIAAVPDATHITYATTVSGGEYTEGTLLASTLWLGADSTGQIGLHLAQLAFFYDWCHSWLVANGHDQLIRDNIKALYYAASPARPSNGWNTRVRESDFHNYATWNEAGILEAGIALYGDDPLGAVILNEGAGYFWEGVTVVNPEGFSINPNNYTFNIKVSNDTMTGGAMNWEGSRYWRSAAIRMLHALEAYDAATNRQNDIWHTQFPNTRNAGLYRIYLRTPSGTMAPFGDASNGDSFAGRDNFGLAIINDRFPRSPFRLDDGYRRGQLGFRWRRHHRIGLETDFLSLRQWTQGTRSQRSASGRGLRTRCHRAFRVGPHGHVLHLHQFVAGRLSPPR